MTSVNIAKLKAQLSRYLRAVRKGEEIIVTDHQQPIAKIVPLQPESIGGLEVRKATRDPAGLATLRFPPSRARGADSLTYLLEERGVER